MKSHTRILSIATVALLLPVWANGAERADGCCAGKDPGKHDCGADKPAAAEARPGCCSGKAAPIVTAFASPPPAPVAAAAKEMSDADRAFLASYEEVRAALAGDDLEAAKKAAADINGGEPVAKAKSIAEARIAFKGLSARAIAKAKGHAGFYVAHCPMVKGGGADWLATKKAIENPYFGSAMFACGYIKE